MLPPTRRYCLLTPRLYHDLVLRLLHPSAIPTLPITCVCRCGYYYYVRCRLIFRSRALSVVYGTALAPASTSFSCLSFHLFFFFTSFRLDACRTLSSTFTLPTYSITIDTLPLPKYDTDDKLFLFSLFQSGRLYLPCLFFFCSILIIIPVHSLPPRPKKKVYYSFVKATNLLSFSLSLSSGRTTSSRTIAVDGLTFHFFMFIRRFRVRTKGWCRVSCAICFMDACCIRGFLVVPIGA